MKNINTQSYWNNRFGSGDWEKKRGRNQTTQFALSQLSKLNIPRDFSGTILDFGCGLGDALPIYRKAFPYAKLIGLDISDEAISICRKNFNHLGEFIAGDFRDVPEVDIIIASNVFEHLSNDNEIAAELKKRCKTLYIIVPYKEELEENNEHINSYNEESFNAISKKSYRIFKSRGWSENGYVLYITIYLKNIIRIVSGKKLRKVRKQIMFRFD